MAQESQRLYRLPRPCIRESEARGFLKQKGTKYPSDFFPATFWDEVSDCTIRFGYTEGSETKEGNVRKPTERWKGNPSRPLREVTFLDLSRILPVSGRVGYAKIAKSRHVEAGANKFDPDRLGRLSNILGHTYEDAKMASANVDPDRPIPVLERTNVSYSGYHQGRERPLLRNSFRRICQNTACFLSTRLNRRCTPVPNVV